MAAYRRTHGPSRLASSESWQPTGAKLHSLDEPSKLSKRLNHDDSTINIVASIIIIIIAQSLHHIHVYMLRDADAMRQCTEDDVLVNATPYAQQALLQFTVC